MHLEGDPRYVHKYLFAFSDLISEAPKVISPQELVREVQGYTTEVWEARDTVRQHVYNIRQKVKEAGGPTDIIHTVRGVGYTINE